MGRGPSAGRVPSYSKSWGRRVEPSRLRPARATRPGSRSADAFPAEPPPPQDAIEFSRRQRLRPASRPKRQRRIAQLRMHGAGIADQKARIALAAVNLRLGGQHIQAAGARRRGHVGDVVEVEKDLDARLLLRHRHRELLTAKI